MIAVPRRRRIVAIPALALLLAACAIEGSATASSARIGGAASLEHIDGGMAGVPEHDCLTLQRRHA